MKILNATTAVPTSELIGICQGLLAEVREPDIDPDALSLKVHGAVEKLSTLISQYTVPDSEMWDGATPSVSSVVIRDQGILRHDDGSDIKCIAGRSVSLAMKGHTCTCPEDCVHWQNFRCVPECGLLLLEGNILYDGENGKAIR